MVLALGWGNEEEFSSSQPSLLTRKVNLKPCRRRHLPNFVLLCLSRHRRTDLADREEVKQESSALLWYQFRPGHNSNFCSAGDREKWRKNKKKVGKDRFRS